MYKYFLNVLFLSSLCFLTACSEETQQSLKVMPLAYGDQNKLTVVTDKDLWESDLGDTVDFYYAAPYLVLPQPEPILDLLFFSPQDLYKDPLRKQLRSYLIIANLEDPNSGTAQFVKEIIGESRYEQARLDPKYNLVQLKDRWAKGQIIILQFGRNKKELVENLKKNNPLILEKLREHDKPKLEATVYLDDRNSVLEQEIKDKFGIYMRIPKGYFKAIEEDDMVWLRFEQDKISNNIFISKRPYTDVSQISRANIKSIRNELGKYVSTRSADTFMKINDVDLPMFTKVTRVDNKYALEARGVWEMANDYMGGPFVSYLVHNPSKNELLFIDGFIHAPGEDKRNFMQYLEHVIGTVQVP